MLIDDALKQLEYYIVVKSHKDNRDAITDDDYKQAFGCFYYIKDALITRLHQDDDLLLESCINKVYKLTKNLSNQNPRDVRDFINYLDNKLLFMGGINASWTREFKIILDLINKVCNKVTFTNLEIGLLTSHLFYLISLLEEAVIYVR